MRKKISVPCKNYSSSVRRHGFSVAGALAESVDGDDEEIEEAGIGFLLVNTFL